MRVVGRRPPRRGATSSTLRYRRCLASALLSNALSPISSGARYSPKDASRLWSTNDTSCRLPSAMQTEAGRPKASAMAMSFVVVAPRLRPTHAPPPFARMYVPSMNASSLWPRLRLWHSNAKTCCSAPSRRHCSNLRKQVEDDGYRRGISRHGAPVRITHRIPSTTDLDGNGGRPGPPGFHLFGPVRNGSTSSHCSSVNCIRSVDHDLRRFSIPTVISIWFRRLNADENVDEYEHEQEHEHDGEF